MCGCARYCRWCAAQVRLLHSGVQQLSHSGIQRIAPLISVACAFVDYGCCCVVASVALTIICILSFSPLVTSRSVALVADSEAY